MKTEIKHNLVLRKETSNQGYFTYKVVDPATGRVIAKRTATRHFVAALFKWDAQSIKALKIANCFGRMDLIQSSMTKDHEWTAGEVDQLLQGNMVKGYMLATIDPAEVNLNMTPGATAETEAWKQKAKAAEKELKELQEEHEALKEQVAELEYQGEEDRKTIARQNGRIVNLERKNHDIGFNTFAEALTAIVEASTEEDDGTRHLKIQQWLILLAFAKDYQWESNYHQELFQRAAELLKDDNMMTSEVLARTIEPLEDAKEEKSWGRLYVTYQQVCQSKGIPPEQRLSAAAFKELSGGPKFYTAGQEWRVAPPENTAEIERRRATLNEDLRELYDAGLLDYLTD